MSEFNVGDQVELVTPHDCWSPPSSGALGVITQIDQRRMDVHGGKDAIKVRWDDWDGYLGTREYWINAEYIVLARPKTFYLVAIQGRQVLTLSGHPTFDDGRKASAYAKKLSTEMGCKVEPRRFAKTDNSEWREREKKRLDDGTYLPMPDGWDLIPIEDHFLHLSKENPSQVAFTESAEKGILDRQTKMNPGRYLQRYYPALPDLDRKRLIALVDKAGQIHFARTADEIQYVYENGPNSCMSGSDRDFESSIHPVRVYGDSDLQLAYLKDDDEEIYARCLVWPERKLFGRRYGDEARLTQALCELGYKEGKFFGAKIRKIINDGRIVLPYIDWTPNVKNDGKHLIIVDEPSGLTGDSQDGFATVSEYCQRYNQWFCTEDNSDGDDCTTFHNVIVDEKGTTQRWCEDAVDSHACRIANRYYDNNLCVQMHNGAYKLKSQLLAGGGFICAISDYGGYDRDKIVLADGREVLSDFFHSYGGFTCAGNGKNYISSYGDNQKVMVGLQPYSREYLNSRPGIEAEIARGLIAA